MHSVCQVPLKLDEFICILHRRLCDMTIAHMYTAMAMLKRYIVQPYFSLTPLGSDWLCLAGSGGFLQIKLQPLGGATDSGFLQS